MRTPRTLSNTMNAREPTGSPGVDADHGLTRVHGPTIRMTSGLPVEDLLDGLGEGRGGGAVSRHAPGMVLRIIVISRSIKGIVVA